MPSRTKRKVAVLVIVLLHHCAGFRDIDDAATKKKSLSVLLVPFPAPTHMMGMATLGEELVQRGHNVTFCVACFTLKYVDIGRQISATSGMQFLPVVPSDEPCPFQVKSKLLDFQLMSMIKVKDIVDYTERLSGLSRQLVQTLDGSRVKDWDIIIGEYLLWPLVGTLAKKWNVPVVYFSNALDFQPRNLPPWSYPIYGTGYTEDLTLLHRLHLTLLLPIQQVIINVFETSVLKGNTYLGDVRESIRPGIMTPFIVSTSFGFEYPRPLLPLFHYVGPMIKNPKMQPHVDQKLETWLNFQATMSVIYISMGTTVCLTDSQVMAITNGVLSTTYSALWSLRDNVSQEVVYRIVGNQNKHRFFLAEWLPQQSVLQHRSIAMAILHGGMGGVSQCLYYGVPEIIIPFAHDQGDIAARVISGGAGLVIDKDSISAKRVAEAIRTVSSSTYREAAVRFRKIFQLSGGTQRAADLVEFYADVGYEHLVPAYAKHKWSFVKYYNIDVYALLLILLLPALYTSYRFCKCCYWHCCRYRNRIYCTSGCVRLKQALFLTVLVVLVYIFITVYYISLAN